MPEQEQRTEKDAPLHHDIRLLGDCLGRAIQQHGGSAVFDTVEQLRRNCKRLRDLTYTLETSEATPEIKQHVHDEIAALRQEITRIVDECELDTAIDVIRAFTVYFHLVNTAEQHHRTRRLLTHEAENNLSALRGSLGALSAFFQRNSLNAADIQQLLNQLSIELVFTAHPTEATRRTLITKSRQVDKLLEAHDFKAQMTRRQYAA